MKHWPCAQCSESELCDSCWAIRRAEDRQRQKLEDVYAGRDSRALGRMPSQKEIRKANETSSSHRPVKTAEGPPIDDSELSRAAYTPTPLGRWRKQRAELEAYIATLENGRAKLSGEKLARVEGQLDAFRLLKSLHDEGFELGQNSKTLAPTLRYCPDCLPKKTPLGKNNLYCEEHRKLRRKEQNRVAQQKHKKKHKGKQSKQTL